MSLYADPYTHRNTRPNQGEGKVTYTRIDIYEQPGGALLVRCYADGWTASTPPFEIARREDVDIDAAVAKLQAAGWTVRQWKDGLRGARAWKGRILPVRSHGKILEMRERYWRNRDLHPDLQIHAVDFALDL